MVRRITSLTLRDIRSYQAFDAQLSGRSVVLTGPNGIGKTNLLEALTLFGAGRGLRGAKLSDIVRRGATGVPGAGMTLTDDISDAQRLVVSIQPPRYDRREVRIDGEPTRNASALSAMVRFLWLTPAMDRLFVDAPSERRRFLDRFAAAGAPEHVAIAARYDKAMRQRMALLDQDGDSALLAAFEAEMAEAGWSLTLARREAVDALKSGYGAIREAAFPRAELEIEGDLERWWRRGEPDVAALFAERLARSRRVDRDARRTTIGPHRADLIVTHADKAMPARLCSTGEQKALLIGLVLARAWSARAAGAGALVLLLDEIVAHLDEERRAALAATLDTLGLQAFLTGTDTEPFAAFLGAMDHLRPDPQSSG